MDGLHETPDSVENPLRTLWIPNIKEHLTQVIPSLFSEMFPGGGIETQERRLVPL